MTVVEKLKRAIKKLSTLPLKTFVIIGVGFFVGLYVLLFFVPTTVALQYKAKTCVSRLTFLPDIQRTVDDKKYHVSFQDVISVGALPLLAKKVCVSPTRMPTKGDSIVAVAPWGGYLARQHIRVSVANLPQANVAVAIDTAVPATKPLKIPLDRPDTLFTYTLAVNKTEVKCVPTEGSSVECAVEKAGPKQGKTYSIELQRSFKSSHETVVGAGKLTTLRAVTIEKASVRQNQTIYTKPKKFSFTTDKPLANAEASLKELGKSEASDIDVDVTFKGKTITASLKKDLPRKTTYRLTLSRVEATDGSTTLEPYVRTFSTSDGPKVSNVNIGSSRVEPSQQIILSFDQPLASNQDIAKFIRINGGEGTITKLNETQAAISLTSMPRCKSFTITVNKGLESKYHVIATAGWTHTARTICHSTSVYGYSIQGRPLVAYHFGSSGPTTMYVGTIHGNESSSSSLMQSWVDEIENNPSRIGNRRLVIVPTINPDGLAANTRANSRGVNLNRNFPTDNWTKDINDTDGTHKGGGGKAPLSEPESKALAAFTTQTHPRLLLSFHAIGSLTAGDPGGYSASYARRYAAMVGYRDATGSGDTFDYDITGAYEDWSYRNAGIPSIVIELSSYSYANIVDHKEALWAMLQ